MPNQWTINNSGGGGNSSELIGCHISINGTAYQFEAPNGTVLSTTTGTTLPTPPFNFPMFNSALAGINAVNWYISVDTLTDGPSQNKGKGKWSNTGFPPGIADTDTDTWTAQAGVGVEIGDDKEKDKEKEKEKEAAASASPKQ